MDLLKVLACCFSLCVVHTATETWYDFYYNGFDYGWVIDNTYDNLLRWGPGVFLMITGATLLDRDIPVSKIYTKYIPKALMFLIVWGEIYFFIQYKDFSIGNLLPNIWRYFLKLCTGNYHIHLWYLYMLIGMYIITPPLRILCKNATKRQLLYVLAILFVFKILMQYVEIVLPGIERTVKDLKLDFPDLLIYYLGGFYLHKYGMAKKWRIMLYIVAVVISVGLSAYSSIMSLRRNELVTASGNMYLGTCLLIFAAFTSASANRDKIQNNKFVEKLNGFYRPLNFGIYMIHLGVIEWFTSIGITGHSINPILGIPLLGICAFLISTALTLIISKIPVLRKIVVW